LATRDEKPKPPSRRTGQAERLGAALRDNLKRRKAQARARACTGKNTPAKPACEKD